MRTIRGDGAAGPAERGASAALGNFDGVHLGHQAVIEAARRARPDAPLAVATFAPHPRRWFAPESPPFELMDPQARARRLEKLGVELLFEMRFDAALAAMSPAEFCEQVLVGRLGVAHVTVGADFCFGRGRSGDVATLRAEGARLGFGATAVDLVGGAAAAVSSTAIRAALADGRPQDAARMLGHWHRIEGRVAHGEKRGRTLGYPTANLPIEGVLAPRFGVYAVLADVLDGPHAGAYRGVASLGVRPMFGVNAPNLETHLFDFRGDLYGAGLSVALVDFQRPEAVFDGLDALVAQMDADSAQARRTLDRRPTPHLGPLLNPMS
ncbi:MAG: bifunctional riboflavin kinase/FAD synthetase [Rubrimonas sp.]|uniref:bifunctional riboflavin kinase/FAD synthetase n=1 Tax=Rubrimonas sp. TaxID=2036015 RepID=UPI002FDF0242